MYEYWTYGDDGSENGHGRVETLGDIIEAEREAERNGYKFNWVWDGDGEVH